MPAIVRPPERSRPRKALSGIRQLGTPVAAPTTLPGTAPVAVPVAPTADRAALSLCATRVMLAMGRSPIGDARTHRPKADRR
jgi:hypothetical protein